MKILIVIPALGIVYGGPSKIVVEMAQALGSHGVSVDIVATNADGFKKVNAPIQTWIYEKYYRVQYFPYADWSDYKVSFALTKWLFLNVGNYDLVHTNAIFSYPVLPAHWACQLHQVPYIMTPHGMLEPWALAYKAWKKRLYYVLVEKTALQNANAIQITGSPEANSVKSLDIETPLTFVPNGIHCQDFETLPNPEIFYKKFPDTRNKTLIIFLGRLDPKKGLDLLATAFAKVHTQFPQTHLIIAGPDNIVFLPTTQGYFAQAGCLDAVTFTGMLTGTLKYAALAAASLYVAPSYSEGFSVSVLEGMASGLPCVITTGCNFPEAIEAQAAYAVNIDADEVANTLIQCLKNPQQAKAIGDRARKLVFEQYTWESIATKMIQVYTAILNKNSIPVFQ